MYESEIKFELAREKLLKGTSSLALVTAKKALSICDSDVFEFDIDTSIIKDVNLVLHLMHIHNKTYIIKSFNDTIHTNARNVDLCGNDIISVCGAKNVESLRLIANSNNPNVTITDLSSVKKCMISSSDYNVDSYKSYVVIERGIPYCFRNCFNNQHYDYVYLGYNSFYSQNLGQSEDSFNNCTIDTLVIKDNSLGKNFNIESCFKYTSANNIVIDSKDTMTCHLVNRLTYMRGVHNV